MVWAVWHVVALGRTPRNRFPKLQSMMIKETTTSKPRQSWQEQMNIMAAWSASLERK